MGPSYDSLTQNFTDAILVSMETLTSGDLDPKPAGERHDITVDLNSSIFWNNLTYVFGVKAIDEVNLTSALSNLVVVTFEPVTYPQNTGSDPVVTLEPPTEETTSTPDSSTTPSAPVRERVPEVSQRSLLHPVLVVDATISIPRLPF